jgi:hypothetical protein
MHIYYTIRQSGSTESPEQGEFAVGVSNPSKDFIERHTLSHCRKQHIGFDSIQSIKSHYDDDLGCWYVALWTGKRKARAKQ